MTPNRLRAGAALLAATLSASFALPANASSDPGWFWNPPHCDTVYGDGSVTITRSDGAELAPTKEKLQPVTYAKVAALEEPNTLIAIGRQSIQRSSDAGCSWQQLDKSPDDLATYDVAPGPADTAYVYSVNDQPIHRVKGNRVSTAAGPVAWSGLSALAALPGLLRVVAGDGQLYDSTDDGVSWRRIGVPAARDLFVYNAVIDPRDPGHVVIGTMSEGVYVTFDGGRTWHHSDPVTRVNAFSLTISPADPMTVWMEGYDPAGRDDGVTDTTRQIWRSTDGGIKFEPVLDASRAILYNGNQMWASPTDPDLLYFSYGTSFANYGSDLYRFRPSTNELTKQHNTHDGIPSLAFNPADPSVLYLGLAEER
jgi:hypothetical protein